MNVIFLDFNGILDTYDNLDEIEPSNLMRLKKLVDMFEAKIVISSSLKNTYYYTGRYGRLLQYIIDTLLENGIDVIGITPKAESREKEIKMYLDEHPEIDKFCILDDDYEMESLKDNLVKVPMQMQVGHKGFTDEYLEQAISIMSRK